MKNKEMFDNAKNILVGGVNSPARSFAAVKADPVLIKSGHGSKVIDYDDKPYIDYLLGFGAHILGHSPDVVVNCIKTSVSDGFSFATTSKAEIDLASKINGAISFAEKIRFTNSGTEAVMGAIRLARGFTGRDIVVKCEHAYHGHADYLLAKAGSGLATLGMPASAGVPADFAKNTVIVPFNDIKALEQVMAEHKDRIAAVILEPVGGNYGVRIPEDGYLCSVRELCDRNGSLLIFDEVITGFRFNYGSYAQLEQVTPDIITLGKIIGGGLPIGAYAGRSEIFDSLVPLGPVYQASTFAGNQVVMKAGLAVLEQLELNKNKYIDLNLKLSELVDSVLGLEGADVLGLEFVQFNTMFSLTMKNEETFSKFYSLLLDEGVLLAPSMYESNFVSFAHNDDDFKKTIIAFKKAIINYRRIYVTRT